MKKLFAAALFLAASTVNAGVFTVASFPVIHPFKSQRAVFLVATHPVRHPLVELKVVVYPVFHPIKSLR